MGKQTGKQKKYTGDTSFVGSRFSNLNTYNKTMHIE